MDRMDERPPGLLGGKSVLIIEDEYFLAFDAADSLKSAGASIIGPVNALEDAIKAINRTHVIDAAVLDVNLRGEPSYALVDMLLTRRIPLMILTGYDPASIQPAYHFLRYYRKPVELSRLPELIADVIANPFFTEADRDARKAGP